MLPKCLSLAISPCPNDTFIFEHFITASPIPVNASFLDIEMLNQGALHQRWDMVKISCALVESVEHHYSVLNVGAALGMGVGPLLISDQADLTIDEHTRIAIPGKNTTACKLLKFSFPHIKESQCVEIIFSEIEDAIIHKVVDAGVIIHENRFTYRQKKLYKITDLGAVWEQATKLPVPLGCIVMRKDLYLQYGNTIEASLQSSIQRAWSTYPTLSPFVRQHAQAMDETILRQHIQLYVNDLSFDMKAIGKTAIEKLNEI